MSDFMPPDPDDVWAELERRVESGELTRAEARAEYDRSGAKF